MLPHRTPKEILRLDRKKRCKTCDRYKKDKNKEFCSNKCKNFFPKKICRECNEECKTIVCGSCKIGYYCSKKCQTKSWKYHKKECKKFTHLNNVVEGIYNPPANVDLFTSKIENENYEITIRNGCVDNGLIKLQDALLYIHYKLKGTFKEWVDVLFKKKNKHGKLMFPCVQAIVMEEGKKISETHSCNGMIKDVMLKKMVNNKTKKVIFVTYPIRHKGQLMIFNEGFCTLGVMFEKYNTKYKLNLQICKVHCGDKIKDCKPIMKTFLLVLKRKKWDISKDVLEYQIFAYLGMGSLYFKPFKKFDVIYEKN